MHDAATPNLDRSTHRVDFATTDLEAFQDVLGRLLLPRQPPPTARGQPAVRHHSRLRYRRAGNLAFAGIYYDRNLDIDVGEVDDCFIMQIPETQGFEACLGARYIDFPVGSAQLANPGQHLAMRWHAGCQALILRYDRRMVTDHLARLVHDDRPPHFPEKLSLAHPAGASLARLIHLLRDEADRESPLLLTPLAQRHAEHMLVALLLAAAGQLDRPDAGEASCYYVKRAQAFIHANLAAPIGLSDIVAASGVSVRTLYAGFRRDLGRPPMAYVKALRLDRAHAALRDADPGTTRVTDVAAEWGFLHFGRFAADYRARFGETPSETLRRA